MSFIATPLPITATASIVATAWASGAGAAISYFTITPILQSNAPRDLMLQQWYLAYNRGKMSMPPFAAAISLAHFYVSYTHYTQNLEWRGFAAAGALTISIIPFTFAFIMSTIKQLEKMMANKDARITADKETRDLLTTWSQLNFARAMLPLFGTALAIWNLLA